MAIPNAQSSLTMVNFLFTAGTSDLLFGIFFYTEHVKTKLVLRCLLHIRDMSDDPAFMHDEDRVAQGKDLAQIRGDEQDRFLSASHVNDLFPNELDRTDIDSARRLVHDQEIRFIVKLTANNDLLDITTGKFRDGLFGIIVFYEEFL